MGKSAVVPNPVLPSAACHLPATLPVPPLLPFLFPSLLLQRQVGCSGKHQEWPASLGAVTVSYDNVAAAVAAIPAASSLLLLFLMPPSQGCAGDEWP